MDQVILGSLARSTPLSSINYGADPKLNLSWCDPSNAPAWDGEDFSPCFRSRFIIGGPALVYLALSISGLLGQLAWVNRPWHWLAGVGRIRLPTSTVSDLRSAAVQPIRGLENHILAAEVARQGGLGVPPEIRPPLAEKALSPPLFPLYGVPTAILRSRRDLVCTIAALMLSAISLTGALAMGDGFRLFAAVLWAWVFVLSGVRLRCAVKYERDGTLQRPKPAYSRLQWHITPLVVLWTGVAFLNARSAILPGLPGSNAEVDRTMLGLCLSELIVVAIACFAELCTARPSAYMPRFPSDSYPTPTQPPAFEPGKSLLSKAFFGHIDGFLFRHMRSTPQADQIPELRADDKTAAVLYRWRRDLESYAMAGKPKPSLIRALFWHFRWELAGIQAYSWICVFGIVIPPFFLQRILRWIQGRSTSDQEPTHVALLYAFGLLCGQLLLAWSQSGTLFIGRRLCIRLRSIVISEIFAKGLRRKSSYAQPSGANSKGNSASGAEASDDDHDDVKHASAGKVANLISADTFRLSEIGAYLQFVWPEGIMQIVITSLYLVVLLGPAAIIAISLLLLLVPLQGILNKAWWKSHEALMKASDKRMALVTEVMSAIKVVKFFSWEAKFLEKMEGTRARELAVLFRRQAFGVLTNVVMMVVPALVSVATFGVQTKILHRPLTAEKAFTALALFNILQRPMTALPDMVANSLQAYVSLKRISAFLDEEETEKYQNVADPKGATDATVGFCNATFSYATAQDKCNADDDTFEIKQLNFSFPLARLSLITGRVGSGKSTLLLSLLGETNCLAGSSFLPAPIMREENVDPGKMLTDSTAYCPQQPWLLSDTVRNNILFGCVMNEERYDAVLTACALKPDLAILPGGDETEVGEKGTVLSGGQKARLSLARALYSPAKCLLLDDILSAVDSHTAQHLYENVLMGPLMAGRTCILVTHAVDLCLPGAAFVVSLDKGVVAYAGGPAESSPRGSDSTFSGEEDTMAKKAQEDAKADAEALASAFTIATIEELEENKPASVLEATKNAATAQAQKLIEKEKQEVGAVSWAVYKLYIDALGGWSLSIIAASFFVVAQLSDIAINWILRTWAAAYDSSSDDSSTYASLVAAPRRLRELASLPIYLPYVSPMEAPTSAHGSGGDPADYYIRLYVIAAIINMVCYTLRAGFFLGRGVAAGRILYYRLLTRILGAKMRFFDSTPQGRLLNRLSKDQQTIDQDLTSGMMYLGLEVLQCLATVVIIASIVPAFLFAAVFIAAIYTLIGWMYIASTREVKRHESTSRSPIFSLCSESLNGVTSIRAYGDMARFMRNMFDLIDNNNRPFLTLWYANRWLSVRIDMTSALITFSAAAFLILKQDMSASLAGFALTYAVTFSERTLWIVRLYSYNEINMNSVERVREYLELDQEPAAGMKPPAAWPLKTATIEVEDFSARYAPGLPHVLRNVSFRVLPGEKVGICGRTGSGKSTLALSLFRMLEADEGRILIDGLDIAKVDLHELRSRLTIIPQESILFTGSIRSNLDPFGQHDDNELWDALRRVGMASQTPAVTPGHSLTNILDDANEGEITVIRSLEMEVHDGGKNFSTGQRQLIAIARAILKLQNSSVLVLDESTASLDSESDEKIQRTIRAEMGDATILCIAHRLHTIADYDKILCLSDGRVLEYDSPWNLLRRPGSAFAELCHRSGAHDELKAIAEAAARRKGFLTDGSTAGATPPAPPAAASVETGSGS